MGFRFDHDLRQPRNQGFWMYIVWNLELLVIALTGTLSIYANVNQPVTEGGSTTQPGSEITTQSGPAEIVLAQHLKDTGATFYGAWWCPHCHDQKQLFGQESTEAIVPYIECSNPDCSGPTAACEEANVQSYSTWEIGGTTVTGTQSLEPLAKLSGYKGPSDFKNDAFVGG
jgi:hypothetical protein